MPPSKKALNTRLTRPLVDEFAPMNFFSRLFGTSQDPSEELRPLWHETVRISREPDWYRDGGVRDTVDGRVEMIMAVLALVMLRMEASPALSPKAARITELFVEDMDRQLREKGVGDLMVGKNIGKLVSALGGRMGAFRKAFAAEAEESALKDALARNLALDADIPGVSLVTQFRALQGQLSGQGDEALLAGNIRA